MRIKYYMILSTSGILSDGHTCIEWRMQVNKLHELNIVKQNIKWIYDHEKFENRKTLGR